MGSVSGIVKEFISEHGLFTGKEKNILVGFSGGADSVCLLFMLKSLKEDGLFSGTRIIAAHLNHGIRGEEALRDEDFAVDFCGRNGIKLFVEREDVPAIADKTGESEEAVGRRLRYDLFRRILKQEGGGVIATAHHKNDSAETVLFNICRGTGLTGISGIKAGNKDIVRPLMCLTREQIEAYNEALGLDHVNDSTNNDNIYTRNFLRNKIIPLLEEKVNPGVVEHICRLSEIAGRADEFFSSEADRLFSLCKTDPAGIMIPFSSDDTVLLSHKIIREYLYKRVFREISKTSMDFSSERTERIDELFADAYKGFRIGKIIELTHGIDVIAAEGGIRFFKRNGLDDEPQVLSDLCIDIFDDTTRKKLEAGEEVILSDGNISLSMRLTENFIKNDDSDYTKYFDYDKMNNTACFRYAAPDDHITVTADGKKHSLKKELKDRKVASKDRKNVLVLAQGKECLWAVGIRRGMNALAGAGGRTLCITLRDLR